MRRPHYSWVILATGFFILFFSGGSRFAFGLMLKPMSEDLDVSRSTLSLAVTTSMIVSALALPFVGRLVDKWSLKGTIWDAMPLDDAIQAGTHAFASAYDTDEPRRLMQAFLDRKRP